jgi:acetyltransferase-like isoleucine patch superfamily enzyme
MRPKFVVETDVENPQPHDVLACDGRIRVGSGAKIVAGTEIEPPVLIADDARVLKGVSIGAYSYVGRNSIVTLTEIGRYCSIAHDCQINYFRAHPHNWFSTHPFQYDQGNFAFWPDYASFSKRPFNADLSQAKVVIGPDVWLGAAVHVFGGVTIGPGAIIGARAMVRSDIPPYGVAMGTPARIYRYRFDETTIDRMLATKWWTLDETLLRDLPFDDVQSCLELLKTRVPKS